MSADEGIFFRKTSLRCHLRECAVSEWRNRAGGGTGECRVVVLQTTPWRETKGRGESEWMCCASLVVSPRHVWVIRTGSSVNRCCRRRRSVMLLCADRRAFRVGSVPRSCGAFADGLDSRRNDWGGSHVQQPPVRSRGNTHVIGAWWLGADSVQHNLGIVDPQGDASHGEG